MEVRVNVDLDNEELNVAAPVKNALNVHLENHLNNVAHLFNKHLWELNANNNTNPTDVVLNAAKEAVVLLETNNVAVDQTR